MMKNLVVLLIIVIGLGNASCCRKEVKKNIPVSASYNVSVYETAKGNTNRLAKIADIILARDSNPDMPYVLIDTTRKFQSMLGFGGAFTESSAHNFYKMNEKRQKEILNLYFNPESGIGYTLCRVHINSCDFSLESWACDTVAGDTLLKHFNIERDKKEIIPFIKEAMKLSGPEFKLFASPWSPPKWMKTNDDMCHGGGLKPEYRTSWALYYAKFIKAYRSEGLPVKAITVQNEPAAKQTWESCLYSAYEERDFIKTYLGPTLYHERLSDVKIIVWDHNRDIMYQRAKIIYDDPEASRYVWGTGFHWYVGDFFDNVQRLHDSYPKKHLLFTEGCQEGGPHVGEWQVGERYGRSIISDLNKWTEGWVDWNLILDFKGGPNHVGNLCSAPILVDSQKDSIIINNSFYYLGHFSRFIRPGAKRVTAVSTKDELEVTAFINKNHKVAVVVMNRSDKDIEFELKLDEKGAKTKSLAHSIVTYVF
jgi:glucosylceramidase